jgi:signal transduction histidine kinase
MFTSGELSLLDLVHPDDLASVAREVRSAAASQRSYQIGYRLRDPSGHYVRVWELGSVQSDPITTGPEVRGCLILVQQTPFLQSLSVMGRTAAGLAHDLRNLLAVVSGAAELLHETDTGPAAPESAGPSPADEATSALLEATQAASRLATQLGRLLNGKPASLAPVDLNDVVRRMEPVLRALAGQNVTLSTSLEPELGPTVADPVRLDQLLLNLVVNAIEAMPQGGVLQVTTSNLLVPETRELKSGWLARGPYAMLSVSDTGTGIPAEALTSVFEPSYSTKGQRGLGLANVLDIAHGYSGTIDVQSSHGQGSTFSVYLPSVKRPEPQPVSQWRLR